MFFLVAILLNGFLSIWLIVFASSVEWKAYTCWLKSSFLPQIMYHFSFSQYLHLYLNSYITSGSDWAMQRTDGKLAFATLGRKTEEASASNLNNEPPTMNSMYI